jgi:primosomal protein N' (replication factor Y)
VALTRGADAGGVVVVVGESNDPVIQALVRHDAPGLASRELADRAAAGLPPAVRAVEVIAPTTQITGILEGLQLPATAVVLGPAPVPVYVSAAAKPDESEPAARVLITVAFNQAEPLLRELQALRAHRDLHKTPGRLTIKVDPIPFG